MVVQWCKNIKKGNFIALVVVRLEDVSTCCGELRLEGLVRLLING
jgi:hypothetical protein